ncbi:MAG: hypothetical protein LQ346_008624 [Caloplaca aetnensis]|nr:MAG: hypothetical protein LQ346_008624 [Caloplaca aetnensis]
MAKGAVVLAAGFNAHGQLDPATKPTSISSFKQISCVKDYDPGIEWTKHAIPAALWSSTLLYDSNKLTQLGTSGGYPQSPVDWNIAPSVVSFFGDISGIKGFVSESGKLYSFLPHPSRQNDPFKRQIVNTEDLPSPRNVHVTHVTIAGNGKVCVAVHAAEDPGNLEWGRQPDEDDVYEYPELNCLFVGCCVKNINVFKEGVTDLVATSTSFIVLTGDHRVETFGDPRYPALLARTPRDRSHAEFRSVVSALDGIPIRKVVAGSWMVAALSEENDVYVWGHALPQSPAKKDHARLSKLLNAVNENGEREDVHLVDIAGGADVQDVAVGDEHIVLLATDGRVWGLGSNEYGQLGLGEEVKGTAGEWALLRATGQGAKCVEVKAGPLTTFLVVMNEGVIKDAEVTKKEP